MKRGISWFVWLACAVIVVVGAGAGVAPAAPPNPASEELAKGIKLFNAAQYDEAAPVLFSVFRGHADDAVPNRQEAGKLLAKILVERGAYLAAAVVIEESVVNATRLTPATIRIMGRVSRHVHFASLGLVVKHHAADVIAEAKLLAQDNLLLAGVRRTTSKEPNLALRLLAAITAGSKQQWFAQAHVVPRLAIAGRFADANRLIAAVRKRDVARADQLAFSVALLSRVTTPDPKSVIAQVRKLAATTPAIAALTAFWLSVKSNTKVKAWVVRPNLSLLNRVAYTQFCASGSDKNDAFVTFRAEHKQLLAQIDTVAASATTQARIADLVAGRYTDSAITPLARLLVTHALRDNNVGPLSAYVKALNALSKLVTAGKPVTAGKSAAAGKPLGAFVAKALATARTKHAGALIRIASGTFKALRRDLGRLVVDVHNVKAGTPIAAATLGLVPKGCRDGKLLTLDEVQQPVTGIATVAANAARPTPTAPVPTKKKAGGCAGCQNGDGHGGTALLLGALAIAALVSRRRRATQ